MFSITAPLPQPPGGTEVGKDGVDGGDTVVHDLEKLDKVLPPEGAEGEETGYLCQHEPYAAGDVFERVLHTELEAVAGAFQLNAVGGLLLHSQPG